MALTDKDFLKRLHRVSLLTRRVGESPFLQARRQWLPGGGTEVTSLRDYAPGDNPGHIDWNICSRRDELLTKQFEGDLDPRTYVLVDCSASMAGAKFDVARRLAALLGFLALDRGDRVTLAGFTGGLVGETAPICHRSRMIAMLRFLDQLEATDQPTDLRRAADAFCARLRRPGPVVVISDLLDPAGFEGAFDILLRHGHQPRLVQPFEPVEANPELSGDVQLVDRETGQSRRVTVTAAAAAEYRRVFARWLTSVREYCTHRAMRYLQIATDAAEDDLIRTILRGENWVDRKHVRA